MTSDIKERYLKNWSDDLDSEIWTGHEMIKFAASIRAETLEECCKAVCYLCAGKHSNYAATPIISEEYSGIFHVALDAKSDTQRDRTMERCRASAIRDAGKKE